MRKVAVFFGGKSCENEISVLTGVFVLNLLDRTKYRPVPIYVHTDGNMYTSEKMYDLDAFKRDVPHAFQRLLFEGGNVYLLTRKKKLKHLSKIDVALNCCHGGLGEGGGVSALAAWQGIPLASPGVTASSVFMDKILTKTVMHALNIPTVEYIRVNEIDYKKRGAFLVKSIDTRLKYPVIVKPANLGSSIGIATANDEREAKTAIENAFALDTQVIIERYLQDKTDVNCAACMLGGEIFVSEAEIAFEGGVYSFDAKYRKTDTENAPTSKTERQGGRYVLSGELRDKIRLYTKTVYKRMNMTGVVRMDFLVCENKPYLCEVNTVPGSLAYYLFCERISDAKDFFSDLLEDALSKTHTARKQIPTTGILSGMHSRRK